MKSGEYFKLISTTNSAFVWMEGSIGVLEFDGKMPFIFTTPSGWLRSSLLLGTKFKENSIKFTTQNSVYVFEYVAETYTYSEKEL